MNVQNIKFLIKTDSVEEVNLLLSGRHPKYSNIPFILIAISYPNFVLGTVCR